MVLDLLALLVGRNPIRAGLGFRVFVMGSHSCLDVARTGWGI